MGTLGLSLTALVILSLGRSLTVCVRALVLVVDLRLVGEGAEHEAGRDEPDGGKAAHARIVTYFPVGDNRARPGWRLREDPDPARPGP
jgi:hypothetical protein